MPAFFLEVLHLQEASRGPVRGCCSQQETTAQEQRVTTQGKDLEAAHSQTTEKEQIPAETWLHVTVGSHSLVMK